MTPCTRTGRSTGTFGLLCAHDLRKSGLLAVLTAAERLHRPAGAGLIDLTCAEVRRLLTTALATLPSAVDPLAHAADWSRWRRAHQYRAKTGHYARYGVPLS